MMGWREDHGSLLLVIDGHVRMYIERDPRCANWRWAVRDIGGHERAEGRGATLADAITWAEAEWSRLARVGQAP